MNLNDILATKDDLAEQKKAIEKWVQEQIKEAIGNPTDPLPDPCERGPRIDKVTILGENVIAVLFDGKKIEKVEFTATDSKNNIVSGYNGLGGKPSKVEFVPPNNTPRFDLVEKLKNETYCVKFKALNCTGESTYSFNGKTGLPVENGCEEIGKINGVSVKQ